MYLTSILWLISWPVLIWFSYKMVRLALNKYDKNMSNEEKASL
jgi:hypothetical protein